MFWSNVCCNHYRHHYRPAPMPILGLLSTFKHYNSSQLTRVKLSVWSQTLHKFWNDVSSWLWWALATEFHGIQMGVCAETRQASQSNAIIKIECFQVMTPTRSHEWMNRVSPVDTVHREFESWSDHTTKDFKVGKNLAAAWPGNRHLKNLIIIVLKLMKNEIMCVLSRFSTEKVLS